MVRRMALGLLRMTKAVTLAAVSPVFVRLRLFQPPHLLNTELTIGWHTASRFGMPACVLDASQGSPPPQDATSAVR